MSKINLKIKQIVVDKLGVDSEMVKPDANFYDDLGVDSLDFCELMVSIEKEFDIVIEDDLYPKLRSVGALVKYVEQKIAKPAVEEFA